MAIQKLIKMHNIQLSDLPVLYSFSSSNARKSPAGSRVMHRVILSELSTARALENSLYIRQGVWKILCRFDKVLEMIPLTRHQHTYSTSFHQCVVYGHLVQAGWLTGKSM